MRSARSRRSWPVARSDEETRVTLEALEERIGIVEGDVEDALELRRRATKAGAVGFARVSHALYSGGAQVIPSLISSATVRLLDQLGSLFSGGSGLVTALQHDIHTGHC